MEWGPLSATLGIHHEFIQRHANEDRQARSGDDDRLLRSSKRSDDVRLERSPLCAIAAPTPAITSQAIITAKPAHKPIRRTLQTKFDRKHIVAVHDFDLLGNPDYVI
jgi:hypothetical protein